MSVGRCVGSVGFIGRCVGLGRCERRGGDDERASGNLRGAKAFAHEHDRGERPNSGINVRIKLAAIAVTRPIAAL
jgi:hypothetical protein